MEASSLSPPQHGGASFSLPPLSFFPSSFCSLSLSFPPFLSSFLPLSPSFSPLLSSFLSPFLSSCFVSFLSPSLSSCLEDESIAR